MKQRKIAEHVSDSRRLNMGARLNLLDANDQGQSMKYLAMPTSSAKAIWNGDVDANGQVPEQMRSDGNNNPCRHCLHEIAEGDTMLVFSYRPFDSVQPYAETGPIFMHKTQCEKYDA